MAIEHASNVLCSAAVRDRSTSPNRRRFGALALSLAVTGAVGAGLAMPLPALAQPGDYPTRSVKLVVPFAAGGAVDLLGRAMAASLTQTMGQTFYVENKPGAGGLIAMESVATATPDGYTLAVGAAGPLTISPSLYADQRRFDPLTQLEPIVWFASTPGVLVTKTDLKAKTVPELIALSKATPQGLFMASAGSGSINHLMGEYFQSQAGVKWSHIPYSGSSPALTELVAGRVDVMLDIVPSAAPFIKAGKLRALAVTTPKRSQQLPDVPTLAELGYKDFNVSSWVSLLAPKGTPSAIVARLNAALNESLKNPETLARLAALGAEGEGGTPDRVSRQIAVELPRWAGIIQASGARRD